MLLAFPFIMPQGLVKAKIVSVIKEKTGRELQIDGALWFSLFPRLSLAAEDVIVANPPGGFGSELLRARSVELTVSLLPLLRGSIEVTRLQLTDPEIHLEIDKTGRRNWVFHPIDRSGTSAPRTSDAGRFKFGSVKLILDRGTAEYFDRRNDWRRFATDMNVSVAIGDTDHPVTIEASAIWKGKPITFTAVAASLQKLREGTPSPATFKLRSPLLAADFEGNIVTGRYPRAVGVVRAEVPSVRDFAGWVGVGVPPDGAGFGHALLTADIDVGRSQISLTRSEIAVDAIVARGAVTLARGSTRPALSAQLVAETFDLDRYLKPLRSGLRAGERNTGPAPSRTDSPGLPSPNQATVSGHWGRAPIRLTHLKAMDADLKLNTNRFKFRDVEIGRSTIALHLKDGKLTVQLSDMALYGGDGTAEIVADESGSTPEFGCFFDLHGIEAGPFLHAVAGVDLLTGKGDFVVDLKGTGSNAQEIVSSLRGNVRTNVTHGQLTSVGLSDLMKGVVDPIGRTKTIPKEIAFQSLSAGGRIMAGIVYNDDLKLVSPIMSGTGRGKIDLSARALDYRWDPTLPGLGSATVLITGAWEDPSYKTQSLTITRGTLSSPGKAKAQGSRKAR